MTEKWKRRQSRSPMSEAVSTQKVCVCARFSSATAAGHQTLWCTSAQEDPFAWIDLTIWGSHCLLMIGHFSCDHTLLSLWSTALTQTNSSRVCPQACVFRQLSPYWNGDVSFSTFLALLSIWCSQWKLMLAVLAVCECTACLLEQCVSLCFEILIFTITNNNVLW